MNATRKLHQLGQSLWLDNITREMLDDRTLERYIDELCITGLTSNPTIFENAIKRTRAYATPRSGRSATRKRPPNSSSSTRAGRPNLFIKIPGTREGLPAIEQATFAGVPINVTLLFSREHYLAAAEAFLRGIERRIEAGLDPEVGSVASLFVSRWDAAVAAKVPPSLRNRLGIAMAKRVFRASRSLLTSPRWERIYNLGGRPQRLLFASTGTKDPEASDVLYVRSLGAPFTVNTMPEPTLLAFSGHGEVGAPLDPGGGDCEAEISEFVRAGIDVDAVGEQLQRDGAAAFTKSWNELLAVIETKNAGLARAR